MKLWKDTLWNLLGLLVPTLVAMPAMAIMARLLGVERFGLFMLAFALLGYASIFDGGITRAIIRSVALNRGNIEKNREIMGTALWTVLFFSAVACSLVCLGAESIVDWMNVTPSETKDTKSAFVITAFIIPPTLIGMILFSYLEGTQQFARLNFYKTIAGSLVASFPALTLFIEPTLTNSLLGLLVARLLTIALAYFACIRDLGRYFFLFRLEVLRDLFSFGGWVTLSNIISPIMAYFDRFILSHFLGAQHVAFYTAPAEVIARISIIPGALARTIFPLFSGDLRQSSAVAADAYKGLLLAISVIALPIFIAAEPLLGLWLGDSCRHGSAGVLRILIIGFFFNALAQIPFARLQAHGKAKLTATLHVVELVPYLLILTVLVYYYGIYGAATAWSVRVIADYFALEYFSRKLGA